MGNENVELTSVSALAKELGINKSKIAFYIQSGLLTPIKKVGVTMVLDKKKTIKILKKIESLKKRGKELSEMKNEVNL